MEKWVKIAGLGVLSLILGYFAVGGWLYNQLIGRILVVGSGDLAAAGQPAAEPYDLAYRGDPETAFGFAFETVTVQSDIGAMPAWFVPAGTNARDTWVIFVHGIGGVREGGYRYLPLLRETGFPTLLITYRNDTDTPRSKEGVYSFGLAEWPDLDAAISYALEAGASSVLLAGDSMGGGIVGQFLMQSEHDGAVSAIIMNSPALDFRGVANAIAARIGFPAAPGIATVAVQVFTWTYGIDLTAADSIAEVAAFPGPLLLIHGDGDRIVPVSISEHLLAVRRGVTTHLRTGADHLQSRAENPELYEKTIRDFLAGL